MKRHPINRSTQRIRKRAANAGYRPNLEPLEDRCVPATINLSNVDLSGTAAGVAFGVNITASGGNGFYSFTPPSSVNGLTFFAAGNTLTFSGTPAAAGSFPFTVSVQDTASNSGSRAYTLTTAMSLLPQTDIAPGITGQPYSQSITAMGGTGSLMFTNPATVNGLTVTTQSNSIILSGTPANTGSFPFTVSVQDSASHSASASYTLKVASSIPILSVQTPNGSTTSPTSLLPAVAKKAYSQSFIMSGGSGASYVFHTPTSQTVNGLALSASGSTLTLSGTPTTAGTFTYIIWAEDGNKNPTAVQQYTLVVSPEPSPSTALTLAANGAPNLPVGTQNSYYSQTISAFGGSGAYTFTVTPSGGVSGLTFSTQSSSVTLSGTPTTVGTFPISVQVNDGKTSVTTQYNVQIVAANTGPLTLTRTSIQPGTQGAEYIQYLVNDASSAASGGNDSQTVPFQLQAAGGSGAGYFYTATGLPPGMWFSSAGVLGGTPSVTGNFTLNVTVTDSAANTASKSYPLIVLPALPFTGNPSYIGAAYTPAQVQQAYGINNIILSGGILGTGAGVTVAVLEYGDAATFVSSIPAFTSSASGQATYATSDMALFNNYYGLPQFGAAVGPSAPVFLKLDQNVGTTYPASAGGGLGEWAQDVQTIHALAPMANIVVIEGGSSSSTKDVFTPALTFPKFLSNPSPDIQTLLANLPSVSVISYSYGADNEYASEVNDESIYLSPNPSQQPVTVNIAAGDTGYFPPSLTGPQYPGNSANVVSAAMDQITIDLNGNYIGEVAVSNAGGGPSLYLPQPSFQNGVVSSFSTTKRVSPDVAIVGGYNSGMGSVLQGQWQQSNGSSNAAPGWSALLAIVNQGRAAIGLPALNGPTQTLPMLYQLPATDFHKITQYDNGTALPGAYNMAAGLGSPIANRLVPHLIGGLNTISGQVAMQGTSKGMAGWTVYFDANQNGVPNAGEAQTTTNANGNFSFLVAPGTFPLSVVLPAGWSLSSPITPITFAPGSDQSSVQNIGVAAATTTAIQSSSPSPAIFGQAATFTATVSSTTPGVGAPSGTLTFQAGSTVLGSAPVSGGTATFTTTALPAGSNAVTATFTSNTGFGTSTSAPFAVTVSGAPSVTELISQHNPANLGETVTLRAKAHSASGPMNGTVTFFDGSSALGTATLSGGVALFHAKNLARGEHTITARFNGASGVLPSNSAPNAQTVNAASILGPGAITAGDVAAGSTPSVPIFDNTTGQVVRELHPYDPKFLGGVRTATGDVDGDGYADIVTGPGPGGGPDIEVFSGKDGRLIHHFFAFSPSFTGGVFVAAGDVNNDGFADIIVGAGAGGGPNVVVVSGRDGGLLFNFFAYDAGFTGGVTVSAGDTDGDGFADVGTGAGFGGGPNVRVFSGRDLSLLANFLAYDVNFNGGVAVLLKDLNRDDKADIVTAPGPGGGPNVRAFDGPTTAIMDNFFAYTAGHSGGVWLADGGANSSGKAVIRTGLGTVVPASREAFHALPSANLDRYFAFDKAFAEIHTA